MKIKSFGHWLLIAIVITALALPGCKAGNPFAKKPKAPSKDTPAEIDGIQLSAPPEKYSKELSQKDDSSRSGSSKRESLAQRGKYESSPSSSSTRIEDRSPKVALNSSESTSRTGGSPVPSFSNPGQSYPVTQQPTPSHWPAGTGSTANQAYPSPQTNNYVMQQQATPAGMNPYLQPTSNSAVNTTPNTATNIARNGNNQGSGTNFPMTNTPAQAAMPSSGFPTLNNNPATVNSMPTMNTPTVNSMPMVNSSAMNTPAPVMNTNAMTQPGNTQPARQSTFPQISQPTPVARTTSPIPSSPTATTAVTNPPQTTNGTASNTTGSTSSSTFPTLPSLPNQSTGTTGGFAPGSIGGY